MDIVLVLLKQIMIMFLFMGIGFWLFRRKLLTTEGSRELGSLLLQVILPCTIIKAYAAEMTSEKLMGLLLSFGMSLLALLISIIVARMIFGKKYRIEHFGSAFSNAGFIGIPLVQTVLGNGAVFYVSSFVALINILQWTYGVMVMTGSKDSIKIKNMVKNPILISMAVGLGIFFSQLHLPEIVQATISQVAAMNAPVAMIILGTYLAQVKMAEMLTDKTAYICSAVRLFLIPALTLVLMSLLPGSWQVVRLSILIAAATPVGSNVAIFAQLNNLSYTQAVKSVCLSTLFSIFTLPGIIALGNIVWG